MFGQWHVGELLFLPWGIPAPVALTVTGKAKMSLPWWPQGFLMLSSWGELTTALWYHHFQDPVNAQKFLKMLALQSTLLVWGTPVSLGKLSRMLSWNFHSIPLNSYALRCGIHTPALGVCSAEEDQICPSLWFTERQLRWSHNAGYTIRHIYAAIYWHPEICSLFNVWNLKNPLWIAH